MAEELEATAAQSAPTGAARRTLREHAARALAEAKARRDAGAYDGDLPPETGGPKGPEPVRYGDWEKDGIAVDF